MTEHDISKINAVVGQIKKLQQAITAIDATIERAGDGKTKWDSPALAFRFESDEIYPGADPFDEFIVPREAVEPETLKLIADALQHHLASRLALVEEQFKEIKVDLTPLQQDTPEQIYHKIMGEKREEIEKQKAKVREVDFESPEAALEKEIARVNTKTAAEIMKKFGLDCENSQNLIPPEHLIDHDNLPKSQ